MEKRISLASLKRINTDIQISMRDGVPIEKGVILTEQFLKDNQSLFEKYANLFTAYPDVFLDLIAPENPPIRLFPYQRVFLRAVMRYKNKFPLRVLRMTYQERSVYDSKKKEPSK